MDKLMTDKIVLPYSDMPDNKVIISFSKIFAGKDDDLISHYLDKFICNSEKDWGLYFLTCDLDMIRAFFNYHNMIMEADKFSKKNDFIMAQMFEKDKFKVYPFEYEIVRRFFRLANNSSLQFFDKKLPEAFSRIKANDINLYGNGINWSKAWIVLTDEEKSFMAV